MVSDEGALLDLLRELAAADYHFTCVTPATHQRILSRAVDGELTLRDVFGWNRGFASSQVAPAILTFLDRAGCLEESDGQLRSLVRVASLGEHLFLHSGYPTTSADAVFFGPDTYRFVRFICERLRASGAPRWIVDLGAGSGAGGIMLAARFPSARLSLIDINPAAVQLASINARFAGADAQVAVAAGIPADCDLVVANPPYMMDDAHRTYRDGGAILGGQAAVEWVSHALGNLAPGGTMLLYTGAAFVAGQAPLVDEIGRLCRSAGAELQVEELDPDVFGEELDKDAYRDVERIAALGISVTKPV